MISAELLHYPCKVVSQSPPVKIPIKAPNQIWEDFQTCNYIYNSTEFNLRLNFSTELSLSLSSIINTQVLNLEHRFQCCVLIVLTITTPVYTVYRSTMTQSPKTNWWSHDTICRPIFQNDGYLCSM